jgi:hypothetical protein
MGAPDLSWPTIAPPARQVDCDPVARGLKFTFFDGSTLFVCDKETIASHTLNDSPTSPQNPKNGVREKH